VVRCKLYKIKFSANKDCNEHSFYANHELNSDLIIQKHLVLLSRIGQEFTAKQLFVTLIFHAMKAVLSEFQI